MSTQGDIRIGVGGWTFEPWRGVFYPKGMTQAKELEYASRQLTSIEINGTYYGSQKPETYAKWRSQTPDGFVFSVKGPRFAVNRRVLAEAGESVSRFFDTGLEELGDRLGPILWQFAPTKTYNADDFAGFLDVLPATLNGHRLRHVVEPRHDSFCNSDFIALLRARNVGVVYADHAKYPAIADVTADFAYLRLQTGSDDVETAYPPEVLDTWADRFKLLAQGGRPEGLAYIDGAPIAEPRARDVFAYIIHEGKVRAPAGAMALIERVERP